jgi:hypothetical protein
VFDASNASACTGGGPIGFADPGAPALLT